LRAINGGAFPRAHPSGACGLLACPSLSHDRITRATRRSESEPGARADEASKQRCDWGTASMEKRAAAAAASPARKETGISDSTRRDDRLRLLRDSLQVRPRSAHGDHLPVAEDAGEENASRRTGGKERGSPSARSFIDRSTTARTRPLPLFFQHSALSLLHVFFACSLKNRRFRAVAHTVAIKDRKRARDVEERRERLDRKSGGGPTAAAAALSIRRLSLSLHRRKSKKRRDHGGPRRPQSVAAAHGAATSTRKSHAAERSYLVSEKIKKRKKL